MMAIDGLKRALDLTRAGRLDEAVRLIQQGLAGGKAKPPRAEIATNPAPGLPAIAPRLTDAVPLKTPAAPVMPSQFLDLHHRSAAGQLDYMLYLPPGAGPSLPLIVMLHGCTQTPEDFAKGTGMNQLAGEAGVMVAYPRQTSAANPQKCWNWFRSADQQRDDGEMALIAGIVHDVVRDHHADPARIYIAGLSAGGAAAANMAACYPELFAAVAVHSGLVHGAARSLPTALSAMRKGSQNAPDAAQQFVPTITFHGDRDTTVSPINSDQVVADATSAFGGTLSMSIEEGTKPGGRHYQHAVSRDADGKAMIEQWTINGSGHAWSGGSTSGSYTDPAGPDASKEMLRFFLQHRRE